MGKFTLGISKIELGAVANDGDAGTSLAVLGKTNQDSCKLTQDEPERTEFSSEEDEEPVFTAEKRGPTRLTFQIMNPDTAVLEKLFGGTVETEGSVKTWNLPASSVRIEQTVKVTPQNGMTFIIPRGLVSAKLNGEFSKKNLFVIDVEVTALAPEKAGVGALQFLETVTP